MVPGGQQALPPNPDPPSPSRPRTCANIIWPGLTGTIGLPGMTARKGAAPAPAAARRAPPRPRTGVDGSDPSAPEAAAICSAVGLKGSGWKPPQTMPPPGVPGCEAPCSMLVSEPLLEGPGLPAYAPPWAVGRGAGRGKGARRQGRREASKQQAAVQETGQLVAA